MSQLIGASGSLLRGDFVQPTLTTTEGGTIVSMGSYLEPGPYASLSIDDRSRFRSTSFVPPQSIELMHGFFDRGLMFYDTNPLENTISTAVTFVDQRPSAVPVGYSYYSQPASTPELRALRGYSGQPTMATAPYGQVIHGPVSPSNCPSNQAFVNPSGGCQVMPSAAAFNPAGTNVYF
jgi:hypothetical protein